MLTQHPDGSCFIRFEFEELTGFPVDDNDPVASSRVTLERRKNPVNRSASNIRSRWKRLNTIPTGNVGDGASLNKRADRIFH